MQCGVLWRSTVVQSCSAGDIREGGPPAGSPGRRRDVLQPHGAGGRDPADRPRLRGGRLQLRGQVRLQFLLQVRGRAAGRIPAAQAQEPRPQEDTGRQPHVREQVGRCGLHDTPPYDPSLRPEGSGKNICQTS